ncbi:MAG: DUF3833 family protein [Pseudomonadota bacterium]
MPNDMSPGAIVNDVGQNPTPVGGPLDLTEFLLGSSKAWGVFEDRFGALRRRFVADLDGRWHGDVFVLNEEFQFDDGEQMTRVWQLTPMADGKFTANADDVVGPASGWYDGDTVRLAYSFMLRVGNSDVKVRFSDRFYRVDANNVINRATVSKWGVTLGEMTIAFQRAGNDDEQLYLVADHNKSAA